MNVFSPHVLKLLKYYLKFLEGGGTLIKDIRSNEFWSKQLLTK